MSPVKKILRSAAVRWLLCGLGAWYIRLVYATGHWRIIRGDIASDLWDGDKPFIVGFWHGRLLLLPVFWDRRRALHMLISQHADGQLIARTSDHFGVHTVAGSTRHRGGGALRTMIKALKAGDCVGITPDGPRGPRMRASDGIITLARMSGAPIVPVAYGSHRGRVLSTWDRFLLPWPFAGGVLVWGEPISVERDAAPESLEAIRRQVEESLNAVTAEADSLCGRPTVEPAVEPTGESVVEPTGEPAPQPASPAKGAPT